MQKTYKKHTQTKQTTKYVQISYETYKRTYKKHTPKLESMGGCISTDFALCMFLIYLLDCYHVGLIVRPPCGAKIRVLVTVLLPTALENSSISKQNG